MRAFSYHFVTGVEQRVRSIGCEDFQLFLQAKVTSSATTSVGEAVFKDTPFYFVI